MNKFLLRTFRLGHMTSRLYSKQHPFWNSSHIVYHIVILYEYKIKYDTWDKDIDNWSGGGVSA